MSHINWKQYDMDVVQCDEHSYEQLFDCMNDHWYESRGLNAGNFDECDQLYKLVENRDYKSAAEFINKHKGLDEFVSVFEYVETKETKESKKETPQKTLLDEMLRISDGYLKYEFEDFFEILKQAILNKAIEGEAVGIASIVVFKPRVYNSKPRLSNMTGGMIKEGSSTTVKAEVTAMFKRKLKEAQRKAKEDAEGNDQGSPQEA